MKFAKDMVNAVVNYYVGIRESVIDRARGASSAALGEDFSAHFVRATQNGEIGKEEDASKNSQPLINNEVRETCGDIT